MDKQTPNCHLSGYGCLKCSLPITSTEEFIDKAETVHGNKYNYSKTIFSGLYKHVSIICSKHGEFKQKPKWHIQGHGCQRCCESRGESKIAEYLENNGILYTRQQKFNGCKLDSDLRFDFYIKLLDVAIEYDGRQHFEPVHDFGGVKEYHKIIIRDEIKNKYCKDNRIKLVRISYKQFNKIEEILDSIFIADSD